MKRLDLNQALLLVVDYQGKLHSMMHNTESLTFNARKMIQAAQALDIPVLLTEQYPEGLGATVPEIQEVLADYSPIPKTTFSCCGVSAVTDALAESGRRQVMVMGIEAHICITQTSLDLVETGYEVFLIEDAISAYRPEYKETALARLSKSCAVLNVEMAIYELLRDAAHPKFKKVLPVLKERGEK